MRCDAGQVGEVSSSEAWDALKAQKDAVLVDVRTLPEWAFVGVPDLQQLQKEVVFLCWKIFPSFEVNPQFESQLQEAAPQKATPLYFICRSGGRSLDAGRCAAALGYKNCYNVTDGFEGPPDRNGQRGKLVGWKAAGLPWQQQ